MGQQVRSDHLNTMHCERQGYRCTEFGLRARSLRALFDESVGADGAEKRTSKVAKGVCLLTVHSVLETNPYFNFSKDHFVL